MFIDANEASVDIAHKLEVDAVEFHTGPLCETLDSISRHSEGVEACSKVQLMVQKACDYGIQAHLGHGINYRNAGWMQRLKGVEEANIGHAIVARSIFCGLEQATKEMKDLLNESKNKP